MSKVYVDNKTWTRLKSVCATILGGTPTREQLTKSEQCIVQAVLQAVRNGQIPRSEIVGIVPTTAVAPRLAADQPKSTGGLQGWLERAKAWIDKQRGK